MHFLLLLLRLVIDRLNPSGRGGLTIAARTDGRIEHLPTRSALWDRWLSRWGGSSLRQTLRALLVRAKRSPARSQRETPEDPAASC
jgi:hypothetical protein